MIVQLQAHHAPRNGLVGSIPWLAERHCFFLRSSTAAGQLGRWPASAGGFSGEVRASQQQSNQVVSYDKYARQSAHGGWTVPPTAFQQSSPRRQTGTLSYIHSPRTGLWATRAATRCASSTAAAWAASFSCCSSAARRAAASFCFCSSSARRAAAACCFCSPLLLAPLRNQFSNYLGRMRRHTLVASFYFSAVPQVKLDRGILVLKLRG